MDNQGESSDSFFFFVNGTKVVDRNVDPETTLLSYLRQQLGLTGAKLACGEGGCGACTVMVSTCDPGSQHIRHYAVNSCLTPICSVHGKAVITTEGIGNSTTRLHPVQERIIKFNGSQCGFCTPGFVMSMYSLLRSNPEPNQQELSEAFQGNLCRCTGYRGIIEGYQTFVKNSCCGRNDGTKAGKCCDNLSLTKTSKCCKNTPPEPTCLSTEHIQSCRPFCKVKPLDPTQEPIFPPELLALAKSPPVSLDFQGPRVRWLRPVTLEHLLQLKNQFPDARLVVGNTEVGVEIRFKNKLYPVILEPSYIQEMSVMRWDDSGLQVGASCRIAQVKAELQRAVPKLKRSQVAPFVALMEQLRWFGGSQVRNVAAIGGNIMTASPLSDLNPLLLASRASLTFSSIDGSRTIEMTQDFFTGYRSTATKDNEVLISIHIPYSRELEFMMAFKQGQRREDDMAVVNAAMRARFGLETSRVTELEMVFGGMGNRTLTVTRTASLLIGKLWNSELLEVATNSLLQEIQLPGGSPGGMETYRCSLCLSFLFKFYLHVQMELQNMGDPGDPVPMRFRSVLDEFQEEPIKSTQLYQEVPTSQASEDLVGRPVEHLSAARHATGEAVFISDEVSRRGELHLALITSTKPHARILDVDPSKALSLPGVRAYVGAADVPGNNQIGIIIKDEEVFAKDKVTCVGQVIGAVAADSAELARRAVSEVQVTYADLEPVIITIEDAIKNESFYEAEGLTLENGNVDEEFTKCEHLLEGEVRLGGQEHFYLETQAAIAIPNLENGTMEITATTQGLDSVQRAVARVLGIPCNHVNCTVKRLGGGFGGKESKNIMVSTATAVAAKKLGCPVRCELDRDVDMVVTGGRHPFLAKYKVGYQADGRITAVNISLYSNGGNSLDLSSGVMLRAMLHTDNCYRFSNISICGRVCRTNLPSNTAFRGFGAPQAMFITETIISEVSTACILPPKQVRELNFYNEGDQSITGQVLENFPIRRCWEECLKSSGFFQRQNDVTTFNRQNRWKKRGISILPTKFCLGFNVFFLNQGGALVHIYTDGSVLLAHGGIEMGQGLHTKMIQVAGRCLGLPVSRIRIADTCTNSVPNASATAASFSTDLYGMALMEACKKLLKNLEPFKNANPTGKWEDWVNEAYRSCVSLSATGFYSDPELMQRMKECFGKTCQYFSCGVACSEVEIDCLTGSIKALSTHIVMDVGRSINPALDIGQIEGAFAQGFGLFLLEELQYSHLGELRSKGPGIYKIPAAGDIPRELHVSLLSKSENPRAIFSSKGVGEPPLFLAASVFFAVKAAILSAREDAGKSRHFRLDSPATVERVRLACQDNITDKILALNPESFTPWSVRV